MEAQERAAVEAEAVALGTQVQQLTTGGALGGVGFARRQSFASLAAR